MIRIGYFFVGTLALLLGLVGTLVPLLPTVPFLLLAAFCFARGYPPLEIWLVEHPQFGPHIKAWRQKGAIRRSAKRVAVLTLVASAGLGLALLHFPWSLLPPLACCTAGAWILSRPDG